MRARWVLFFFLLAPHFFAYSQIRKAREFKPLPTPAQEAVPSKAFITPTHTMDAATVNACLDQKADFNLAQLYSKNVIDDQGLFGSCSAYASTDSLELAWWRFNQSFQLNTMDAPEANHLIPFLTEPIFYAVKNEIFRRYSSELEQAVLVGAEDLIDGDYVDRFTAVFVDMLKDTKKLNLYAQSREKVQSCQTKAGELRTSLELLLNTSEGATLRKKAKDSTLKAGDVEAYLDSKVGDSTLRQRIHSAYENFLTASIGNAEPLSVHDKFLKQLNAYRVKLPQFQSAGGECDSQVLKTTFLRHLCAGIPFSIGSKVRFEGNKLIIDANSDMPHGHAMLLSGYKAAVGTEPFKFVLKNSHVGQPEVEVSPKDLCAAIQGAAAIINEGSEENPAGYDMAHLPAHLPNTVYEMEKARVSKDGILEWGEAPTTSPDAVLEDPKAIDPPARDHPAIRRPATNKTD